jgi:deoxyribodipyrimidine photo-lyase
LYHFPTLQEKNLQAKFDHFPWEANEALLKAWQTGQTGYPIVDAGMRELWQTGSMHNRVRMIVASFLVKNLRLHWHHGERWFWDCLVDADLASNSASWQWCAGSGADAAPYFRIFNPTTQGQRFDPDGEYTRRYVPELLGLPNQYLYEPWACPVEISRAAGIVMGKDYPAPIVEVKASREAALLAFSEMKRRAAG